MGKFLSFLPDYLWTLREYWWALVPDMTLAALDLISKMRTKEIKFERIWYLRLFVAGVIVAQTLAYKELKGKTEGLSGAVQNVGVFEAPGLPGSPTIAMVEVAVSNTGNPSAVVAWSSRLTVGDKAFPSKTEMYWPVRIPPEGIPFATANQSILFKPSDSIIEKTSDPLATGSYKDGWVIFSIPGLHIGEVLGKRATLEVFVHDVYGHVYTFKREGMDLTLWNKQLPPELHQGLSPFENPAARH